MNAKMTRRNFITLLGGAVAWPLAARAQSAAIQRLHNQREAVGQVVARSAVELHPRAILARDHAEAIVLDLM